jgi:peptidyl-prolyl cis-trans isomerase B (cyclophilin B)
VKNYNILKIAICSLAIAFVLNSCSKKNDEAEMPIIQEKSMTQVTIKTSVGDIQLELDGEKAPITVENFVSIANSGYYAGTIFHRVINGFMVQGGGLNADMSNKSSDTAPIQNEANNGLANDRGTIAMARTMEPHSATGQFFINHKDNSFLNHTGENPQGWGYAVFGKVTEGMDVVDAIADVATGSSGGHQDVPLKLLLLNR